MCDNIQLFISNNSLNSETPESILPESETPEILLHEPDISQMILTESESSRISLPGSEPDISQMILTESESSRISLPGSETSDIILPENIRKRRSITVKEKLNILDMVDSGHKLSAVAREFGIASSTASTIVKERHKIKLLSDHYNIDPERKRMRLGIYRDVDEAVHLWFRQMRMKNIPINGPMLQQKAREFAVQLGHKNFEGSSGWLFRFRERYGLSVKTMRDNDDDNTYRCSGIGMTDDEIVTSVCHNTVHSLRFSDSKKDSKPQNNSTKSRVSQNSLVPKNELNNNEDTTTFSLKEAITLAKKLTSFLKSHSVPSEVLNSMNCVSNFMDHDLRNQMKQRKITEYFKP